MDTFFYNGKQYSIFEQFSKWHLITYAKPVDFQPLIKYSKHYAYIYHDKDDNEPHYHILLSGKDISANSIKSKILSEQNTRFELMEDRYSAYLYLTHINEPNKAKYGFSDIICDNVEFWQKSTEKTKEDKNEQFIIDLMTLNRYQLACKYGRDYMRHYKQYHEFICLLYTDDY